MCQNYNSRFLNFIASFPVIGMIDIIQLFTIIVRSLVKSFPLLNSFKLWYNKCLASHRRGKKYWLSNENILTLPYYKENDFTLSQLKKSSNNIILNFLDITMRHTITSALKMRLFITRTVYKCCHSRAFDQQQYSSSEGFHVSPCLSNTDRNRKRYL